MKKVFLIVLASVLLLTGCEKVSEQGNYKPGTYMGSSVDNYGGNNNEAIAVVYVDDNGKIASVYLDTTYQVGDSITTKRVLKDEYNMKKYSSATYEWYEQMEILEDKIIEEQGTDFITWSNEEETKTDAITGVTIQIDAVIRALNNALAQAK